MGRLLAGALLLCMSLPCYLWYAGQPPPPPSAGWSRAAAAQPTPSPPYQLLNESQPPPTEELLGLADDDDATLMDVRGFRWLLPEATTPASACAPLVLVLVHTAMDHVENRRLIRETWGSHRAARPDDVLVRFLVGRSAPAADGADELQRRLEAEAAEHGDLVQGSFTDAYRNMTYKHAMGLKWFATHCPSAKYVLKVDDDVFVNTPVLLNFLRRALSPHGARRLLACTLVKMAPVRRSWRSKWRVAWAEFPSYYYPPYCEGWAVLYSPDVALGLYRELQHEPYFWIDDVLVTGVVAGRLGVTHVSWEDSLVLGGADLPRVLAGEQRPAFMLGLWYRLGMDSDSDTTKQRLLWTRVLEDQEQEQLRARAANATWTRMPGR